MKTANRIDLTQGPIFKTLLKLAVPVTVSRILIMAFFENKEGEYHLNQSIITSYPQQSCLCSYELRKGPFSHRQLCCWMPGIEPFLVKGGKLFYHR